MNGKRGTLYRVIKKINNWSIIFSPCHCYLYVQKFLRSIFNFMTQNNLSDSCQSGFRSNDCTNQLIPIIHNIYCAFDANPSLEVPSLFLDSSKAFVKVWHEGLLYKLKNNKINGNALQLIKSFLHNRRQRFDLNGQSSSWLPIRADVPRISFGTTVFSHLYKRSTTTKLAS